VDTPPPTAPGAAAVAGAVPPALDDDEDVVDAEIVETAVSGSPAYGSIAPDYSDSGVPSLGYLRDRIEGRDATAAGSAELAQSEASREQSRRATAEQQAAVTAERQRAAREQAGKDKLEEIRRQLHPER
jgi:phage shock protein A